VSDHIVIYAASESDHRLVQRAVGQPDTICLPPEPRTYDDRLREREALARARCLVFTFRVADLADWVERVRRIAGRVDVVPRVLVTDRPVQAAALLGGLRVNAMVTIPRLRAGSIELPYLDPLGGTFEGWARELEGSRNHPDLIVALAYALRQMPDHPVRGPKALEQATGLDRVQLSKYFREAVDGQHRFEEFLSALVVISARWKRGVGVTWRRIGADIGLHERTVRAKVPRWLDVPARDLVEADLSELLQRFDDAFLDPLIGQNRGMRLQSGS
jgi:hypothetical protein